MAAAARRRVAVTCHQMQVELPRHLDALAAAGYDVIAPPLLGQQFSEDALIELLDGADGIIAGDDPLSERVLASSPTLRVVVRWGIGMDSVDHDAAARLGITVRNTPGVFGDEVADSALAYVLLLARGHHRVDRLVRDGEWPKVEGVSLSGERLGVVGLGSIGRAIVARGRGFGMDVVGSDPLVQGDPGCDVVSLDELLSTSRFVVLAAPLTAETHHLINSDTLARMRADAFLINVGRGPLVDESALISTLQQGRIAGAGLDVFEVEPLPLDSPLRHLDGVILGAHNGSNTRQGVARASDRAVEILREELERA